MGDRLTRVVGGVAERLCWRFAVHGKADPDYEPASGGGGPFDPDRARRLRRGETFQRLDASGRPRLYDGLSWRPVLAEPAEPASSPFPGREGGAA